MLILIFYCIGAIGFVDMFSLPGKFQFELSNSSNLFAIPNRGYYNNTNIELKINCKPGTVIKLGWLLRLSECIDEFYLNSDRLPNNIFDTIYQKPNVVLQNYKHVQYMKQNLKEYKCDETSSIIDIYSKEIPTIIRENTDSSQFISATTSIPVLRKKRETKNETKEVTNTVTKVDSVDHNKMHSDHVHEDFESIAHTWQDGSYLFILYTELSSQSNGFSLDVTLELKHGSGYISANDWPFLPFFGVMCAIYSLFALFWLVCSAIYWRDLLRLQMWIGGVIFLGLIEKAAYLAEYEEINRTGEALKVAMLIAEIISCFKRSLARMLVIIVSLGFGIVKPRLGPTMQKVVGVGSLYFVLAVVDGVFRIMGRKEDTDNRGILAGVPLVIIDVSVCYWILCNLQQTMRTLKVRRNIPKLTLYRHFTNTLIFSVIASVIFMMWSLKRHRFVECLKDWKELWLDEGFWHILFSFILLVIIVLWRPSNNSQRFAFTPLLDNEEDNDMDEEQETEIFDSVKMRTKSTTKDDRQAKADQANQKSIEDDLKWVEENVPLTLVESAMPGLIDSEEEQMSTKLEMSKMD